MKLSEFVNTIPEDVIKIQQPHGTIYGTNDD